MLASFAILQAVSVYLPPAYLKFCATDPMAHCQVAKIDIAGLIAVNLAANTMIKPKPDDPGAFETWSIFPAEGDCSDYALSKRQALIGLGMDPKKLTIVIGEVQREGVWRVHMVLEADLGAEGVFVLDNMVTKGAIYRPGKHPLGLPWREVSRSSPGQIIWTKPPA